MKKILMLIILICVIADVSYAQRRKYKTRYSPWRKDMHKIYIAAGASNFLGDLGGANKIGSTSFSLRDFDIQAVRPAFHLGYLMRFSENFAWRSSFDYMWLSGNDKWTKETFRNNRNLNFRTPIYGLSTSIVFLYEIKQKGRRYNLKGVKGSRNIMFTPYAQVGIGGFYFNSKGKYEGNWYSLKPLCTEGEGLVPTRKKYSSVQLSVPMGLGVRVKVTQQIEIGIEYSQWLTFTDYIDDVSTTYFDPQALLEHKGPLAVKLANPSPNAVPGNPLYTSTLPGQQRGDPRDKDHMMGLFFTFYYSLNETFSPKLRF